ncbi:MAG: putative oxidoreductase [Actinomycetia bacterium]|nr:putative oxidoreductase [Actinomycetes bacterium]
MITDAVRAILEDRIDETIADPTRAITLPPAVYTDPEFFEFEKDSIFMREWICVGRQEEIPERGDYLTVTIADEPLVIVRDETGQIRAMSSVCQHRSMVITDPGFLPEDKWYGEMSESSGNCGMQLRCPYHFWVYDLRGQLVGAPEMRRTEGFDRREIRLPNLKVEIWNGFIFVNFDLDAAPLAPRMWQATEYLENWHLEDMAVVDLGRLENLPWNWKVMLENVIEIYHADRLHLPIHEMAPASKMLLTPSSEDDAIILSRAETTHADYSFNATMKALFPVIDTLTEADTSVAYFGIAPPTMSFGTSADSLLYLLTIPKSVDKIDLVYGTLFPKKLLETRRFKEVQALSSSGLNDLMEQDVAATKSVQRGLKSRFAPRGRYSWQEEPIPHFNRWLVKRYRSALEMV